MFGLDQLFSDLERALAIIGVLVALTVVLVLIILTLLVYAKFAGLPLFAKFLVGAAIATVFLMVAVVVGWVAEDTVVTAYGQLVDRAVYAVRWYDGLTRRHPIIPVLWLIACVVLCWPFGRNSLDEEE